MSHRSMGAAALAVATLIPGLSQAHVTLETSSATAGSTIKAVMRVPHGCDGTATVAIRILIPEGATEVKPQPKPGWNSETVKGKYATPVVIGTAAPITEGVKEVVWSGGRLLDEQYDEFVLRVRLPDKPGSTVYFPVVQQCEAGVHRWVEVPVAGKSRDELREPAPQLALTPATQAR